MRPTSSNLGPDRPIILLWPTALFPTARYLNSTKTQCAECQQECWIGPAQRTYQRQTLALGVCFDCVTKKATPEQLVSQITKLTEKQWGE